MADARCGGRGGILGISGTGIVGVAGVNIVGGAALVGVLVGAESGSGGGWLSLPLCKIHIPIKRSILRVPGILSSSKSSIYSGNGSFARKGTRYISRPGHVSLGRWPQGKINPWRLNE